MIPAYHPYNVNFKTQKWKKESKDFLTVDYIFYNNNLIKKKINRVEKLRFNLSYLLCLMRGVNANYEEKITFFKNKNDLLQNNGIFFSLLA